MFFEIGNICITKGDIEAVEECGQVCQKLFVDAMLEKSDAGEGEGGTDKLTVNLRMCVGTF